MPEKTKSIWMDGALQPWDDARVHVLSQGLHYGSGVFEGIRCYATDRGPAVFRLDEHVARFFESAQAFGLKLERNPSDMRQAILDTVHDNGLAECYVRPLAFGGAGGFDLTLSRTPVHVIVAVWPWTDYLGPGALARGIRAKVSPFLRPSARASPTHAKITGHYVNSILAKQDASDSGFDEAIQLDADGHVLEASSENLFLIREGGLVTPPPKGILDGITRQTVMELARDVGLDVREASFDCDALYAADEVFLTGTAAEVVAVREVDGRTIGRGVRGPLTARLQSAYSDAVHGKSAACLKWLTFVS